MHQYCAGVRCTLSDRDTQTLHPNATNINIEDSEDYGVRVLFEHRFFSPFLSFFKPWILQQTEVLCQVDTGEVRGNL